MTAAGLLCCCRGHLASSVQSMPSLESLSILFCPQLASLSLQCSQLTRLRLQGNRALCEVSVQGQGVGGAGARREERGAGEGAGGGGVVELQWAEDGKIGSVSCFGKGGRAHGIRHGQGSISTPQQLHLASAGCVPMPHPYHAQPPPATNSRPSVPT